MDIVSLSLGLCIGILPWSEKWNTLVIIFLSILLLLKFFRLKKKPKLDKIKFIAASIIFWVSLIWLLNTEDIIIGYKYIERISSSLIFPLLFALTFSCLKVKLNIVYLIFMGSCILRYFFFMAIIIDWELFYILDYWKEVLMQLNQIFLNEALHPSYFTLYLGFCVFCSYVFLSKAITIRGRLAWFLIFVDISFIGFINRR